MNKEVTIYSMSDPLSNKIFYVGQTIDLKRRIREHKYDPCSNALYDKMKYLKSMDIDPIYNIIEVCDIDQKIERELYWIMKFIHEGIELINREYKYFKRDQRNQ